MSKTAIELRAASIARTTAQRAADGVVAAYIRGLSSASDALASASVALSGPSGLMVGGSAEPADAQELPAHLPERNRMRPSPASCPRAASRTRSTRRRTLLPA